MDSNGYDIVKGKGTREELEQYRQCFENNGSFRSIEPLLWLHQQNLANTHIIYYAMHEGQIAAIYTAMPVLFRLNGEICKAMQSIDTITDIQHRGKGLFPKLASQLYNDAPKDGYELVYGFPNENSAPGFFNKLKWTSFGETPFLIKPLSVQYIIRKLMGKSSSTAPDETHKYSIPVPSSMQNSSAKIVTLEQFDETYDDIWNRVSKNIPVAVDRSAAYMNWRYVDKPHEEYSKCGIYINNKLTGVVVFTIKNKHNGRIGYIMELIYDPNENPETGNLLLRFAGKVFKKEKADAALAWCFRHSFNYAAFKRSGYLNFPEKFRPQHLYLGVRSFKDSNKQLIENSQNWYISYSDSDTV